MSSTDNYTRSLRDEMTRKSQELKRIRDEYKLAREKEREERNVQKEAQNKVKGSIRRGLYWASRFIAEKAPEVTETAFGLLKDAIAESGKGDELVAYLAAQEKARSERRAVKKAEKEAAEKEAASAAARQ